MALVPITTWMYHRLEALISNTPYVWRCQALTKVHLNRFVRGCCKRHYRPDVATVIYQLSRQSWDSRHRRLRCATWVAMSCIEFHLETERLASAAEEAARGSKVSDAERLYLDAAEKERAAFDELEPDKTRTR